MRMALPVTWTLMSALAERPFTAVAVMRVLPPPTAETRPTASTRATRSLSLDHCTSVFSAPSSKMALRPVTWPFSMVMRSVFSVSVEVWGLITSTCTLALAPLSESSRIWVWPGPTAMTVPPASTAATDGLAEL